VSAAEDYDNVRIPRLGPRDERGHLTHRGGTHALRQDEQKGTMLQIFSLAEKACTRIVQVITTFPVIETESRDFDLFFSTVVSL
jgi:hypothetical protein